MSSRGSSRHQPSTDLGARQAVLSRLQGAGQLDLAAVTRAERIAERTGQPIEQVLNQLGALNDDALVDAYAAVTGLSIWDPTVEPPMAANAELPVTAEFLRRIRCAPLALNADRFLCAACDPLDREMLAGLHFATKTKVELRIARPGAWRAIADSRAIDSQDATSDLQRLEREIDQISDLGATSAGSRVVASAFEAAIKLGASDIHFEPRRHDLRVRLRVDGRMIEHLTASADVAAAVVSRVKVIANLDVGERRLPQDGRTSFVVAGRPIDVRVATSPTVFGESAVLRILDRSTVRLELPALGVSDDIAAKLDAAIRSPHGMFLISGPTGSGKTTTLYALLQSFAGSAKKVLSVEDPVEYHFEHVTQTQVAPQIGLTFASALRSFLRQDPDVVLVGEIRDTETAAVAVQAAMTGHLLLASVHANDAISVIPRLLDMGVEPFQLAAGFRGAAAQRLIRRLCSACSAPRPIEEAEAAFIKAAGLDCPRSLMAAQGCPTCSGSGYRGRVAMAEALLADEGFVRAIAEGGDRHSLTQAARLAGYLPMAHDGALKIHQGLTTLGEVVGALHG